MQKYYGVKWSLIEAPIKSCVLLYSSVSQSEIPSHPQRQSFHSDILFLLHILWIYLISHKRCHFILLYNLIKKKKSVHHPFDITLLSESFRVNCEIPRPPSLWCVYDPPPVESDKSKPKEPEVITQPILPLCVFKVAITNIFRTITYTNMCDVTGVDCSDEPSENHHTTKQLNSSTVIHETMSTSELRAAWDEIRFTINS